MDKNERSEPDDPRAKIDGFYDRCGLKARRIRSVEELVEVLSDGNPEMTEKLRRRVDAAKRKQLEDEYKWLMRTYAQVITFDAPTDFRFTWRDGSKQTVANVVEVMIKTNGLYFMKDMAGEWHTSEFGADVMTGGWERIQIGEKFSTRPYAVRATIFDMANAAEIDHTNFDVKLEFQDYVQRLDKAGFDDSREECHDFGGEFVYPKLPNLDEGRTPESTIVIF